MTHVTVRQATREDVSTIVELRRERAAWLSSWGSDQWSGAGLDETTFTQRVKDSIAEGRAWVAVVDEDLIGTITVDHHSNPGLWTEEELRDSVIAHRMIVRSDMAGQGIGKVLLDKADEVASSEGRPWVRLDAWTTNEKLHRLYEQHGFQHVRTMPDYHTSSAALFERRVESDSFPCDLGIRNLHALAYGPGGNPPA